MVRDKTRARDQSQRRSSHRRRSRHCRRRTRRCLRVRTLLPQLLPVLQQPRALAASLSRWGPRHSLRSSARAVSSAWTMLFAPAAWLQLRRPLRLRLQRPTRTTSRLDSVECGCIAFLRCRQAYRLCLLKLVMARSANVKTYRERHGLAVRRRPQSVLQPTYPRGGAPSKRASNRTGSGARRSNVKMPSRNGVSELANSGRAALLCGHRTPRCKPAHIYQRAARFDIYAVCASSARPSPRACAPEGRRREVRLHTE